MVIYRLVQDSYYFCGLCRFVTLVGVLAKNLRTGGSFMLSGRRGLGANDSMASVQEMGCYGSSNGDLKSFHVWGFPFLLAPFWLFFLYILIPHPTVSLVGLRGS